MCELSSSSFFRSFERVRGQIVTFDNWTAGKEEEEEEEGDTFLFRWETKLLRYVQNRRLCEEGE